MLVIVYDRNVVFFSMIFFVRKRVLSVSHFIRRRSHLLYNLYLFIYFIFPGRSEQTARRTHG